MDKKLLFIVNPRAGRTKSFAPLFDAVACFSKAGYLVKVFLTEGRGDATRAAAELGGAYDLVVCAGGDGTFNETISGLLAGGHDTPIGYLPAGSTNDFASSLHLSKNLVEAARDIVEGTPRRLDVGRFNDRYFSYVASFGAFTRASYATSQNVKNALGHLAYLLSGIKELAYIRSRRLRFTLDDGRVLEDEYIFGAISNSTSVAGILTLSEDLVDMNDGVFELLLVRKPENLLELNDCVLALTTQDYHTPMLTFTSARSVEIEAPEDMDWTLDGEREPGSAHCRAENLHDAIRIVTRPAPCARLEK